MYSVRASITVAAWCTRCGRVHGLNGSGLGLYAAAVGEFSRVEARTFVSPVRVWSRREVLARPSPVPGASGVYGWWFRQLPPRVDASGCCHHEGLVLAGRGLKAIAEGLTRDDIPSPSAYDPRRNRHRCGIAWSYSAVRAILSNPRYTGRQV